MDRQEIDDTQEKIEELDTQISAADVEIKKTKDREDKVIVFRAVATQKRVQIPNEEARLDDPKVHQEITSFQPERRDSYTLRPSVSRRDPFVDVRREVIVEDPEAVRKRYEAEENVTLDLEKRHDEL